MDFGGSGARRGRSGLCHSGFFSCVRINRMGEECHSLRPRLGEDLARLVAEFVSPIPHGVPEWYIEMLAARNEQLTRFQWRVVAGMLREKRGTPIPLDS